MCCHRFNGQGFGIIMQYKKHWKLKHSFDSYFELEGDFVPLIFPLLQMGHRILLLSRVILPLAS